MAACDPEETFDFRIVVSLVCGLEQSFITADWRQENYLLSG